MTLNVGQVFLVGVGGTGSQLAEPLVRLLSFHPRAQDATITFVDGDDFEAKNSSRQLFRRQGLNRNKAQYTADSLRFLNPNLEAWVAYVDEESFTHKLHTTPWGEEELMLVIASVDNHQSRRQLLRALIPIVHRNWLFITPGNGLDKGQVLSYGFINGGYVGMNPFDSYPDIANPEDMIPRMGADCIEQAVSTPQLITANGFAAMGTLLTIQSLLDENSFPSEIHFDVRKVKMTPNMYIKLT